MDKLQKHLPEEFKSLDPRMFIDVLMRSLNVPPADYVMGTSKLFFKSGKLAVLEKLVSDTGVADVSSEVRMCRCPQPNCLPRAKF